MTSDILKRAAEAVEKFSMWDVIPYEDDPLVDGLLRDIAASRTLVPQLLAALEAAERDKRFIIEERDRTFALMLSRAQGAEAREEALKSGIQVAREQVLQLNADIARVTAERDAERAVMDELAGALVHMASQFQHPDQMADTALAAHAAMKERTSTLSPVAAAAGVLLADDVAISRMAEAIHDGPLGAEGHWFSAATEQGGWCVDVVRAGLRALAEQEKADG